MSARQALVILLTMAAVLVPLALALPIMPGFVGIDAAIAFAGIALLAFSFFVLRAPQPLTNAEVVFLPVLHAAVTSLLVLSMPLLTPKSAEVFGDLTLSAIIGVELFTALLLFTTAPTNPKKNTKN